MSRSFSSFLTLDGQQTVLVLDFGLISEVHDEAEDWGLIAEAVTELDNFTVGIPIPTLTPAPGL